MGLSGRKVKQRIPNDPRNLSWADDASRFGSTYLSKLGFDHSNKDATLGLSGNGLSEHLKVHHKLDLLGIGAQHTKDPNGIAWKQNKDFENVLRRLNAGADGIEEASPKSVVVDGFQRSQADVESHDRETEDIEEDPKDEDRKSKTNKKRKREDDRGDNDTEKRKKKKNEKKDKKDKKNKTNAEPPVPPADSPRPSPSVDNIDTSSPAPRLHKGRSHRARFIAAKRLAATSSAAVSEILGIPSSFSLTPASTSGDTTPDQDLHKLNISSKSVADYFKDKMKLVAESKRSVSATDDPDWETGVRGGIGSKNKETEDEETETRVGLGMMIGSRLMTNTEELRDEKYAEEDVKELAGETTKKQKDKSEKKKKRDEEGKRKKSKSGA